jgi:hypothetical protein
VCSQILENNEEVPAMTSKIGSIWVVLAFAFAVPAFAHHAVQAEFDFAKAITVSGTITRVDYVNPHGYLYLDVKDTSGKVTKWSFEMVGPAQLRKAGLGRGSGEMKPGDAVTVVAEPAKDGTDLGLLKSVKLPDGRLIVLFVKDPNEHNDEQK